MLSKFTLADKLLFVAALVSLVFSETLWFSGDQQHAIFVGGFGFRQFFALVCI
jgi:hypothetical protein